ncbi:hypothetical protein X741_09535 [Mesorhizobium sp. LNHC229A00]|nr:hypothetical protein X741_09535 [Mesorhizobium sp. LNHC229A00]
MEFRTRRVFGLRMKLKPNSVIKASVITNHNQKTARTVFGQRV